MAQLRRPCHTDRWHNEGTPAGSALFVVAPFGRGIGRRIRSTGISRTFGSSLQSVLAFSSSVFLSQPYFSAISSGDAMGVARGWGMEDSEGGLINDTRRRFAEIGEVLGGLRSCRGAASGNAGRGGVSIDGRRIEREGNRSEVARARAQAIV